MLQQEIPEDFVIATGRMELLENLQRSQPKNLDGEEEITELELFGRVKGLNEIGIRADNGQVVIRIDPRYFRPAEVDELQVMPLKQK